MLKDEKQLPPSLQATNSFNEAKTSLMVWSRYVRSQHVLANDMIGYELIFPFFFLFYPFFLFDTNSSTVIFNILNTLHYFYIFLCF